jgi:hypothetical protein
VCRKCIRSLALVDGQRLNFWPLNWSRFLQKSNEEKEVVSKFLDSLICIDSELTFLSALARCAATLLDQPGKLVDVHVPPVPNRAASMALYTVGIHVWIEPEIDGEVSERLQIVTCRQKK